MGLASGSGQHRVHLERLAVCQRHEQPALGLLDTLDIGFEMQIHALEGHLLTGEFTHLAVEAAQKQFAAIDQVRLAAQPVEDAGKLHRDVAAAQHQETPRHALQIEHLVGRHRQFATGEVGHPGPAADGHQNLGGAEGAAVDLDAVGIDHPGPAVDQLDPGVVQQPAVDLVETLDLAHLVVAQRGPVEARRLGQAPAEASGVFEGVVEMGGIGIEFLGHATHVHAGAAQIAVFGNGHSGTGCRCSAGSAHPTGAGTNHEQVIVEV